MLWAPSSDRVLGQVHNTLIMTMERNGGGYLIPQLFKRCPIPHSLVWNLTKAHVFIFSGGLSCCLLLLQWSRNAVLARIKTNTEVECLSSWSPQEESCYIVAWMFTPTWSYVSTRNVALRIFWGFWVLGRSHEVLLQSFWGWVSTLEQSRAIRKDVRGMGIFWDWPVL